LTAPVRASTIMNMNSPGGSELEELTRAGVADDKRPETMPKEGQ
jgi:hypothetical protein